MNITNEITRLQSARNTIREKLTGFGLAENSANLSDCAEAITHIENNGAVNAEIKDGGSFTIPAGYHNGKGTVTAKDGYGEFWNAFKTDVPSWEWDYLFAGRGWDDVTFNPNYNITVPHYRVNSLFTYSSVTNLAAILERNGITFDASKCTFVNCWWQNSKLTHCPVLDLSSAATIVNLFYACSGLTKVDKLIFSDKTGSSSISTPFHGCSALTDIEIEGTIACDFDIKDSNSLNKKSIESIIDALSETVSGKKLKLSQDAVINAFGSIDDDEFRTLLNKRPNWSLLLSGTTTV